MFEHFLHMQINHLIFCELSIQIFCTFVYFLIGFFFLLNCRSSFYFSGHLSFNRYMCYKIFSQVMTVLFVFLKHLLMGKGVFWQCPQHVEVPGPRTESAPQQ